MWSCVSIISSLVALRGWLNVDLPNWSRASQVWDRASIYLRCEGSEHRVVEMTTNPACLPSPSSG